MTAAPQQAAAPAVRLDGLTKHYGEVEALSDVSLALDPGRFLVLLGPSGSGKSTLIRCLAGIERPSRGAVSIGGSVVADHQRHVPPERRDLTMVFQDFALWPHMSVAENVGFALRRRRIGAREAASRALAMLDRVGLPRHAQRYPHELSGGEQQRVALARALVAEPALLLFDEPLSSLDANLRERLRIEIGALVREAGASAVYITHDQQEAFALGDEIGVLQAGRLVQQGTPEAIYRLPATPFVAQFTGLAGRLVGRVVGASRTSPELVRVALETTDVTRQVDIDALPLEPLAPGAAAQVMLRPTAITICSADAAPADMRAVVRDGAYHGRGYDYVLQVGPELQLTGVFDSRRFARGEVVGISIDPRQAHAFSTDPTVSTPLLGADAALPVLGSRGGTVASEQGLSASPAQALSPIGGWR